MVAASHAVGALDAPPATRPPRRWLRRVIENGAISAIVHLPVLLLALQLSGPTQPVADELELYEIDSTSPAALPPQAPAATTEPPAPAEPPPGETAESEEVAEVLPPLHQAPSTTGPPPEDDDPYESAEAGQALVASEGSDPAPYDFTIVQGEGARYAGGHTTPVGTSRVAQRRPPPAGREQQLRAAPPPAARPAVRRSPPPVLARFARPKHDNWSCPFPSQADLHMVHRASVQLRVQVGLEGQPRTVLVLSDPGHGFGDAARRCALGQRYQPAFDTAGNALVRWTPAFHVHFRR